MNEVAASGLVVLIFHAVLSVGQWVGLVLLRFPGWARLDCVWALALVKWPCLQVFASRLCEGKPPPALCRLVSVLCLLPPVLHTSQVLVGKSSAEDAGRSHPDVGALLLGSVSSALAWALWDKSLLFGDDKREEEEEEEGVDFRQLLIRVLKYFRPDSVYLIAAFGFLILGVFCDSYIPLYQGQVVDGLSQGLQGGFHRSIGLLGLLSFGSALFSGCRGGIFKCALARLNQRLKRLLFQQLTQQDVHFFEANKAGSLSSRLHSDVDRMGRTVALNANLLVRSSVKTLLMSRLLFNLSWELTLLICGEMLLMLLIEKEYAKRSKVLKEQTQDAHAQNRELVSQAVGGIRTVRAFGGEAAEEKRYREALDRQWSVQRRANLHSAVFLVLRRLVTVATKILMLLEARVLISSGRLTVGSLVSFFLYQKPMSLNLREILYACGETVSTRGVISKVLSYLDRKPRCRPAGDLAPEKLEGRIVFQDVSFSYPSASADAAAPAALKSVSMELRPGTVTALVGPSGGGKTSCVSLLKRLYEPQEGNILLDGEPLHRYRHKYFHQKVALVSQNPALFSGSLRYNVEYGLKDCGPERAEEAAKKIKADELISELKDGYDTDIGECGGKLSDGVKQHIAILRALVRDPQVVVLDEATSKLDIEAQHAVLPEVLSRGRTVLVVAHQLKTVEEADHIVFMENGSIAEQGTHQQLMARRGRYHRLKEELFSSSPPPPPSSPH